MKKIRGCSIKIESGSVEAFDTKREQERKPERQPGIRIDAGKGDRASFRTLKGVIHIFEQ